MSSDSPTPISVEEYRALRATIRERGTARWIVIAVTFVGWAWLVTPTNSLLSPTQLVLAAPIYSLVPLIVLAAGFEIVFGLHVGVERVGRYLQARYEPADGSLPQWEHEAMAAGAVPELSSGVDPLAGWLFVSAAFMDLAPFLALGTSLGLGLTAGLGAQLIVSIGLHVLFILRVMRARRFAAVQRANDLRFFARSERRP